MEKRHETLRTQVLHHDYPLTVVTEEIRTGDGATSTRTMIKHPGAVVMIPQCDDTSLLLIHQYRHAIGQTLLEFPAGTLEPGEAPLAAAKRELAEEVGQGAAQWVELGSLYPAPGFCNEIQHLFLARGLVPRAARPDPDEIIEVSRMRGSEVEAAIAEGRMLDAKSIAIYMRAKLHGYL